MSHRSKTCYCGLIVLVVFFPWAASSFVLSPALVRARHITSTSHDRRAPGCRASEPNEGQEIIPPHLDRSAPPVFIVNNNVLLEGNFVVSKEGEPTAEELSNENLIKIVAERCDDEQVNILLWKCLGYRYSVEQQAWLTDSVFPKWKKKYPEPPDLLGITRIYEREVDVSVMKAVQSLVRAVPPDYKRGIMEHLRPVGFTGFKLNELTPNRTRRAQATNFILYFRESLWGVPLEELRERRRERLEREARKPLISGDDVNSS